ncbi:aminoacylase-1-like isoform X3 [Acanthaster planci]|uniref:N-acyl-aliphatic-L-amino acid amidohydrolase n=1 Tax=Acanthaster planci TaxID=133434 RepID=A0A8B7ZA73_ACAPL|nr:aminoacylase-1-like isoform X3 [Acanthaster planci]
MSPTPAPQENAKKAKTEDQAVSNFREYLRIKTVHPEPDYAGALLFLQRMATELGLPYEIVEVHPGKDVFIMTWEGRNPALKSVILNSHTDVVPVYEDLWKCDAFEAVKYENGDIYARGTQDMKSVGIQYIEAVRRLIAAGVKPLRTIHLTFMPDEEVGGIQGMMKFLDHPSFLRLNMGFGLDEGLANPTNKCTVFYGERAPWWLEVKCEGNPGHGSRFIENTAAEKLQKVINSFLAFREEEKAKMVGCATLGDVTSTNLTIVKGGVAQNVVPSEFQAVFDIRVSPNADVKELEEKIAKWTREAGEGVTYHFVQKNDVHITELGDKNVWWKAFEGACKDQGVGLEIEVFPAATDSRFLRAAGYPCLGFSPMNNTPILLHDNNEFLNEEVFLTGIQIYEGIIAALGNVPANEQDQDGM